MGSFRYTDLILIPMITRICMRLREILFMGSKAELREKIMWKRINPNVEYVIAVMCKKGEDIKNGISKVRRPEESEQAVKAKHHSSS